MSYKPLLDKLVRKGKPLAEVVVILENGCKKEDILDILDNLSEDVGAQVLPAYFQSEAGPMNYQLRLDATKEALEREFGWILVRKKIYDSNEDNGKYPDGYCWEELNKPQFYPVELKGQILSLGLTQPGANDNGRSDDIKY